jgi:hypothetical protein
MPLDDLMMLSQWRSYGNSQTFLVDLVPVNIAFIVRDGLPGMD